MPSYLHQIVLKIARKHPSAVAIVDQFRTVTYNELGKEIDRIAACLAAGGLRKGERVGIVSRNSIESIGVFFAASRAGGIPVPLNYTLKPSGIVAQARDCEIAALYFGQGMEGVAKEVGKKVRSVRFMVGDADFKGASFGRAFKNVTPPKLAAIIYTSGTTARPLGVMLSHRNLISNACAVSKYLNIKSSDKACLVLPLYYIYGLSVLLSHLCSCAAVILDNRFMYPNLILDAIDKNRATTFAGVSSHYTFLLSSSDIARRELPSLKRFLQAGDRMPELLTKKLIKLFPRKKLYLMYGQTEASPRLTYLDPKLARKKPGSVGRAIPGVKVKVVDKAGKECCHREEGEIIARGDGVMVGYWNNKARTQDVIRKDWLYTGDVGYGDAAGDLFITGRKKDFVKIGGNRVNLREVEEAAGKHKSVLRAVAVDVRDSLLGRKIKLFVTPAPGKNISGKEIIKFCKSRLASYKVPKKIIIVKR